jgi:hypothetical protein
MPMSPEVAEMLTWTTSDDEKMVCNECWAVSEPFLFLTAVQRQGKAGESWELQGKL